MENVDCVVIGAGVVGLAIARSLSLAGRDVIVLEAAEAIGTKVSSRSSEVVHAGIYYPHGSLKAGLCVKGRDLLYAYCLERGIGHARCGKLIVATHEEQVAALQAILAKGKANGVNDLVMLTQEEALAMEPALRCVAAVHSPSTGIVDSHSLMLALQGDLENSGGVIVLRSPFRNGRVTNHGLEVTSSDGTQLLARSVVNSTGLSAPDIARKFDGLNLKFIPNAYYAKGNYFTLSGRSPFSHLIYPLPEVAGLGVHLTLDLGGQAKFGPDVQWVDSPEDLDVDSSRGDEFYAEVRKYWPTLRDGALMPGYAGVRPKVSGQGDAASDFLIQGTDIHGVPGLVNLFGIESPGLTSCLAIAEYVSALLD